MTVMIQDYGRDDNAACDKTLGRFLCPDLGKTVTADCDDKYAEE